MIANKITLLKIISVASVSIAILTACSILSPVKTEPSDRYVLNKTPAYISTKKSRPITLLVTEPEARPIYNTTKMAYSIKPYQISYFAHHEWAETPAQMLQPLILQTLRDTHYFRTLVVPPYTGRYDYTLNIQLLELRQDFTHRIPILKMAVQAQIIRMSTNRIIATQQFTSCQVIPRSNPYGGVFAANRATTIILRQIANFCLANMS